MPVLPDHTTRVSAAGLAARAVAHSKGQLTAVVVPPVTAKVVVADGVVSVEEEAGEVREAIEGEHEGDVAATLTGMHKVMQLQRPQQLQRLRLPLRLPVQTFLEAGPL